MHCPICKFWFVCFAFLALGILPGAAADAPIDQDWRTGVTVAPGAMTWTADNLANKKQLIGEVAAAHGKACSDNYAFLGWAIGHGGPKAIIDATRQNYEKDGYSITQKPGSLDTDIVWIAQKDAREAVILWSAVHGSTIYLSCITAGAPAAASNWWLYLGILLGIVAAVLLAGVWLYRRGRARTS